ncbi:MAG: dTDP-4-dehydrorhamnose reductase [Lachnospiraceae bacterium]|nr:dTDP-4-dehydrorhamnose reductase [Lachnospiraceae bacterium]
MKKILVTGCNGQLGRAINEEYKSDDVELINTDVAELDITNVEAVMDFVSAKKPDVIINCAAHTNVNKCESEWDLAYKINAIGPRNLSIAAKSVGAKMIHVSTDYVFDGTNTKPYVEFDDVAPLGAYGKTKLEGERFVKQFSDKYFIVRTAWLYGDGNNFAKTMIKLGRERDEIGVVADQYGSPTSAKELAKMIHAIEPTDNYGLFHGTCEGSCSWADFAEKIFELMGMNTKVKRLTTKEYPTPAKRPAYSVLDNYMLKLTTNYMFKDWEEALKEYIDENTL